jgi:sec-independent protein translocase protein TatA
MNTLFAWAIGGTELIIILVAVLILFGSKKIPEFARGLGQGIKEFKKASREVTDEIQNAPTETPAQSGKSPAAGPPPSAPTVSQSSNPPKA